MGKAPDCNMKLSSFIFAVLSVSIHSASAQKPSVPCILEHCPTLTAECPFEAGGNCLKALECANKCSALKDNKQVGCSYLCEMTYGYKSPKFQALMNCMHSNKCFAEYPADGTCLAKDSDAVQNITHLDQLQGDWWVI